VALNDDLFFAGIQTAESATQIGLGAFFAVAFALVRRHLEYLAFACLCCAMAVISASVGWANLGGNSVWMAADRLAYAGSILAVLFHFSFIVHLLEVPWRRRAVGSGVLVAAVLLVALLGGSFWNSSQGHGGGWQLTYPGPFPIRLGALGVAFHVMAVASLFTTAVMLLRAAKDRRFDIWITLGGNLVAVVATVHDSLVLFGWYRSPLLTTHSFSVYAFATAVSLVIRYRYVSTTLSDTTFSLQEKTDALRESGAILRRMQRELGRHQQLAAVGELAATIAHEVRNPLAIIVNAVAGLRRTTIGEADRHTLLSILDEESARLNRLVTDLLRYARPVNVNGSMVSVLELVRRAESRVSEPHRLTLDTAEIEKLPPVWADANLLRLVFDNVIANARAAMPDGGLLRVSAARVVRDSREYVCVNVVDSGQGMTKQVLVRATDPFYTTRPSGTGLGLPIVQRILDAHEGFLEIESTPGEGTAVSLILPTMPPSGRGGDES
jgi:signal transduction histidine kinase